MGDLLSDAADDTFQDHTNTDEDGNVTTASTCCNTCCPEAADVTIENNEYTLTGNALDITVANTDPADVEKKTVAIQVQDDDGDDVAGSFRLKLWFVDDPNDPNGVSINAPTEPGWAEHEIVTDSDGSYTLTVQNTGTLKTWYLCASLTGGVELSDAITIGN